ncbi:MAG TPA: crosslink repair DNA glycosylase YcaQ family protein [Terriglobales bacterium]|nr:crosslink repair DNA glycosylase YcaQ family protein [Terriglobales bacterium]
MTELELQHLRRDKWRLEGEPLRTFEDVRQFVSSVGLLLVFPVRPMPLLPTLLAACLGTDRRLPERKQAFADPRAREAQDFAAMLLRDKIAFAGQLQGELLLVSGEVFPFYYALISDRKPKEPLRSRSREKASPLSEHVFRTLEKSGPLTSAELRDKLGGALSETALDRALQELAAGLKIAQTEPAANGAAKWDLLVRWASEQVAQGIRISDAEALSALLSKYLDSVVAATQEEIENFFSNFASRSRVAEVVRALLSAREFAYTPSESRTLLTVA